MAVGTSAAEAIGRDEELARIEAFLTSSYGGAALVLEGEAGIGKTTLWTAGVERARGRGFSVLVASPAETERELSFATLGDLVGGVLEYVLEALPGPQRSALEVALLLTEAEHSTPDPRAVAVAVLSVLRVLSRSEPVLVAVDDVQWLDTASAGVLGYAARRIHEEPIGLLLAQRAAEGEPAPLGLDRAAAEHVSSLRVGPLTLGATHRLLRERLGITLSRPVLQRVHQTAGGNPFYALEIAQALESAGKGISAGEPLPIPPTLTELLRRRLDALPAETQLVLLAAAASSDRRVSVLSAALGSDAEVPLASAVASALVTLDEDRVQFVHPLLADAAYANADGRSRRSVHERLAGAVDDPEQRAHHLALAAEGPDEEVASALEQAAAHARARGASAAAAQLGEQARALTPPDQPADLHRRTLAAAWHWFAAGDTARAHVLLTEALSAAPPGATRAEVMTALGRLAITEGDQPGAADLLQRTLAEAADDDAIRAEASQGFATALFFMREELETARAYEQIAVDLAQRAGDRPLHLNALATRGLIEALLGRPEAAATIEATFDVVDVVDERVIAWPAYHRAYFQLWVDEPDRAAAALSLLVVEAMARGDESSLSSILSSLSLARFVEGRWEDALRHAEDAHEASLEIGQRHQQAWSLATRALIRASLGVDDLARQDASEALAIAGDRAMGVARIHAAWALGLLELSRDRPEETIRVLAPVREQLVAAGVAEPGSMRFVPDEIEAHIVLGMPADAEEPLAWLEACGRALDRASALGAVARCQGFILSAEGDHQRALQAFERALVQHERVPIPFDRARTLLALGSAQRRAKKKSEARATLEHARSLFEQLGAIIWEEKTRAELRRIGGRAPSRDALTPTERRVAELVAEGKTNKEVAAALFVSPRTVEFHLRNVFRKLGVHTRGELGRRLSTPVV